MLQCFYASTHPVDGLEALCFLIVCVCILLGRGIPDQLAIDFYFMTVAVVSYDRPAVVGYIV